MDWITVLCQKFADAHHGTEYCGNFVILIIFLNCFCFFQGGMIVHHPSLINLHNLKFEIIQNYTHRLKCVHVPPLIFVCIWRGLGSEAYVLSSRQIALTLTIRFFSRRHLVCPCGQLQISFEFEGMSFGAGASFLVSTLTVHGTTKRARLWAVTLVFQQFPVHCPDGDGKCLNF